MLERTHKGLLGEISRSLHIPHFSVKETNEFWERRSVQIIPVNAAHVPALILLRVNKIDPISSVLMTGITVFWEDRSIRLRAYRYGTVE
jgi:hypothetical protein